MDSNSSLAQGGIAAVIKPPDNFDKHIKDTLKVGQGLSDRKAVETLVHNGPKQIEWLREQGVTFSKTDGELDLTREGGHSARRVVHAGDITGYEIQKTIVKKALDIENINIVENTIAIDLLVKKGVCTGVRALDKVNSQIVEYYADITILATGGVGQLYAKTSNPLVATGDGIAMAWRASARLRDLEFVQFHPSILDKGDSPYFLISEAVRGEGGVLVNSEKEAFMTRYHPMQDLAPRDIVSRAIIEEQKKGPVYIDIRDRDKKYLKDRFPGIYDECLKRGVRMDQDLIPVSPAAHYFCGGVKTDLRGRSSIPGLWVIGESACTGIHGANRMASNSLLECLVFSDIASRFIEKKGQEFAEKVVVDEVVCETGASQGYRGIIENTMWTYVGIHRDIPDLLTAQKKIDRIYTKTKTQLKKYVSASNIETMNLACLARLITMASHTRTESRGTHMLNEYPVRDDENWLKHIEFEKEKKYLVNHGDS